VALLSLLGISIAMNERAWTDVIELFAVLAAVAIAISYRRHRNVGPLLLAGLGLALILWVMNASYSRVFELTGFISLAAAVAWDWKSRPSGHHRDTGVSWVSGELLANRLRHEPKPVIVDVREPEEFAGELGHLPGARNLPLGELTDRIAELAPFRAQTVVLVCRTQVRSAKAASRLKDAGFADIAVLSGGMERWNTLGFETVQAGSGNGHADTARVPCGD
jgi:rhodanese-related sulfurtransferase